MIQVIELSKDYGDVKALNRVSFEVKKVKYSDCSAPTEPGKPQHTGS